MDRDHKVAWRSTSYRIPRNTSCSTKKIFRTGVVVFMFELVDIKHAESRKSVIHETVPVSHQPISSYGAADESYYLYQRSKFEDGEILTYFKSRRMTRAWVHYWVILQGVLLLLQFFMYWEVSAHSSLYDQVVHKACNADKAGSCHSRLWQVRSDENHVMDKGIHQLEAPIPVHFSTSMWEPMAIQIDVLSDPPDLRIPYRVSLKKHRAGDNTPEKTYYEHATTGVSSVYIEENGKNHDRVSSVEWDGSVQLAYFHNHFSHNSAYSPMLKRVLDNLQNIRVIVNEMNALELATFHRFAPVCDVSKSWNKVIQKAMSAGADRLHWIKHALSLSILTSIVVSFCVWTWYSGKYTIDGLRFHYLVAAKTLLQDLPLQAIVLWYIFSWYEGGGGEKCQLCMLDFLHCEKLNPFHFTNFLLVVAILASALSNQFLFTTDPTSLRTEDDYGFVIFVRVMLISMMILPFSTAMIAFNGSLIQLPSFFHTVFIIPCFAGWVGLFTMICFPVANLVDEDDYLVH